MSDDDAFDVHECVYGDINVQVRIAFDPQHPASAIIRPWILELRVKQPQTMMQFSIASPFLTEQEEWQDFLYSAAPLALYDSGHGPRAIEHQGADLVFIVHPSRLLWSVPSAAVLPALTAAVTEAIAAGLEFVLGGEEGDGLEADGGGELGADSGGGDNGNES